MEFLNHKDYIFNFEEYIIKQSFEIINEILILSIKINMQINI